MQKRSEISRSSNRIWLEPLWRKDPAVESKDLSISLCFYHDDNGEGKAVTHPYCHITACIQSHEAFCRAVSDALDVGLSRNIAELNVNARLQHIVARQCHHMRYTNCHIHCNIEQFTDSCKRYIKFSGRKAVHQGCHVKEGCCQSILSRATAPCS